MSPRRFFTLLLVSTSVVIGFLIIVNVYKEPIGRNTDHFPITPLTFVPLKFNRSVDMLKSRPWWNIWKGDPHCSHHTVHLLDFGSQPDPGALVSFPGSGNTWLRSLLMGITGVYVTTVYLDETRNYLPTGVDNISYRIPVDCGCSLLQKTHDFSMSGILPSLEGDYNNNLTKTIEEFHGRGILLIRDPYKAIVSYRNFQFGGKIGKAPESAFQGDGWDRLVIQSITEWETLARVWIRGLRQGGVVYYENLRHNSRSELTRLMSMMNTKYDTHRFECVLRHINDNAMKRKSPLNNRNRFNQFQRTKIREAIENVQQELKKRGLMPLPIELYGT